MKSKSCFKAFSVFLCMVMVLSFFYAMPASANSAMTWWEGTESSGAIIAGKECPIVVERELLTFDIQDFQKTDHLQIDWQQVFS